MQTVSRVIMFLESKLQEISQDVQSLAIVTYALSLVHSARANEFNTQLKTLATEGRSDTKFM